MRLCMQSVYFVLRFYISLYIDCCFAFIYPLITSLVKCLIFQSKPLQEFFFWTIDVPQGVDLSNVD